MCWNIVSGRMKIVGAVAKRASASPSCVFNLCCFCQNAESGVCGAPCKRERHGLRTWASSDRLDLTVEQEKCW